MENTDYQNVTTAEHREPLPCGDVKLTLAILGNERPDGVGGGFCGGHCSSGHCADCERPVVMNKMEDLAASPPSQRRPTHEEWPCIVRVEGPLATGVLLPGGLYRVVEVREHWEPSGVDGEPPEITTVVRFDPATRETGLDYPAAIREGWLQWVCQRCGAHSTRRYDGGLCAPCNAALEPD